VSGTVPSDQPIFARTLVSFSLALLCAGSALADSSFDRASQLYAGKQYAQALPLFLTCLKSDPRNRSAFLYSANCYYMLGQAAAARQTYDIIVKSFPGTPEANSASSFLSRLQPPAAAATTRTPAGAASDKPGSARQALAPAAVSAEGSLSNIVSVVRPLQDHPAVSEELISSVVDRLDHYPNSVKAFLRQGHIKVCLTTTLIDRNPELKNREGRGYEGGTYKSCPGMYYRHDIVICERTMDENSEEVHAPFPLDNIMNTLNHECGHALDECLGDFSESDEFKHVYLLDSARIEPDVQRELAYYLQKSDAGQQECCGELIGIILGSEDRHTDKMRAAFPQTIALLRKKLNLRP
jgi:hypothetical protein